MSFNIDALGLDEKPTEKVSAKITKTRKGEVDALTKAVQQTGPDSNITEEEIIEKLIGIGLDTLKRKAPASGAKGSRRGQGGEQANAASEPAIAA